MEILLIFLHLDSMLEGMFVIMKGFNCGWFSEQFTKQQNFTQG